MAQSPSLARMFEIVHWQWWPQVLWNSTHLTTLAPHGLSCYIRWVTEGLFCGIRLFDYRETNSRWSLASSCLRVLLQMVYDHDPDEFTYQWDTSKGKCDGFWEQMHPGAAEVQSDAELLEVPPGGSRCRKYAQYTERHINGKGKCCCVY